MQNLNEWRNWLNHAREQEWANFAAQHGDKLEAVKQAWAAFTAQQQIRQPENAADNASPMQPENANEADAAQQQPENHSAKTTIVPSQPFTQTDFRQPENATTSDTQMQPENTNGSATARPQDGLQGQPENAADNEIQKQPENADGAATARRQDGLQGQPENAVTSETPTHVQNNFMQPENQQQPENANGAATARRQNDAQQQPETTATNETQASMQTNFRLPKTQTQPENAINNENQTQPENANGTATARRQNDAQRQPENTTASNTQTPTQNSFRQPENLMQPENQNHQDSVQVQPENVSTNEPQRQPETQNKATTVNRQDDAQQQPENTATNEPQTFAQTDFRQPENAVTNDTQKQPEKPTQPALPPQPAPTPIMPKHTPPRLPNARCGEPYRADFPLPTNATNITFEPECGLTWDAAAQQIHGTPSQSGDIEIRYEIEENGNSTVHRLQLYINPNPRDLWQTIDSDPNARFAKPDTAHDSIPTPQGNLIAARVRGRSHAHNGTHCDDDYRIAYHPRTGLHFIAVADGAGSAEFSRYGSQLAVNAAANTVWQLLNDSEKDFFRLPEYEPETQTQVLRSLIGNAARNAYAAQYEAKEAENIPLKSLACTLLITLALPRADGTWLVAAYWVGDGAAAVWQPESQQLMLLGESDGGAYSGETVFLSANEVRPENLSKRIRSWQGQQPPALILMTDGVSDPKFETDANLAKPERWAALWQELQPALQAEQPAAALEEWLGFWSAGNHDDRTLALFLPTKAA